MASFLDKCFAPFEGTRDSRPLAIFRIAFFFGLALHFFPTLIGLDDALAPGGLRTEEWNHWLFTHFWKIPRGALRFGAIVTMLGCLSALVGFRTRAAAIVAGVGCYTFASFNGLHVHTLALVDAWAILSLWAICGGGGAVFSLDVRLKPDKGSPREPRLLASLILYQTLLAVFFSGIEKLLAGWPRVDEMGVLLSYPKGFIVRDWVVAFPLLHAPVVTRALTWTTVFIEIGTPILLLVKRTRVAALIAYEAFFFGIVATLEVPPLFYFMFAFGGLLALDDDQVEKIAARIQSRKATTVSPAEPGSAPP